MHRGLAALIFTSLFFAPATAHAEANGPGPFFTLLSASINSQFVSTTADELVGATYTRRFSNPASLKLELGFLPAKYLYLGFVFDLWKAGRTYDAGAGTIGDTLNYQVLGAEIGYFTGNPRAFIALTGFLGYPLTLNISSSTGEVFLPTARAQWVYGGRVLMGIRLSTILAIMVEAGYRLRNLGTFASNGTAFNSGEGLNFSGFYISSGVGFTL